jgi:hypothetical protein
MAERLRAIEEEKAVQEEARAVLLGKKQKGMGQWVRNKFGRFNFVSDDMTVAQEVALEKKRAGEARRGLRVDFEAATKRQRDIGLGEKRLNALRADKVKVAEVAAEEAAMNEDDLDELQRAREKAYLQKWYLGENRAPPSDGSGAVEVPSPPALNLQRDDRINVPSRALLVQGARRAFGDLGDARAVALALGHHAAWQRFQASGQPLGLFVVEPESLAPGAAPPAAAGPAWQLTLQNLLLQGVREHELWIGDRLVLPGCVLVVSEPRMPCYKFGAAMGFNQAVKMMTQSGFCGAYLAVLQPGTLQAGDAFKLEPGPRDVNVRELFRARSGR